MLNIETHLKIIGTVASCYKDKFGTPRQPSLVAESRAFIKLSPEFQPEFSLEGLQDYSHLWVIFVFHKNNSSHFHAKVHPPRLAGETMGVFATRSPHRPNPIGLSLVKIEKVEPTGVWVTGVDLIDGTPVLDIKPYLKEIESQPDARSGWLETLPENLAQAKIEVEWQAEQLNFVNQYENKMKLTSLQSLIEKTLCLDPRPLVYKGFEGEKSPHRENHAVRIYDLDVHFKFLSPSRIQIQNIKT